MTTKNIRTYFKGFSNLYSQVFHSIISIFLFLWKIYGLYERRLVAGGGSEVLLSFTTLSTIAMGILYLGQSVKALFHLICYFARAGAPFTFQCILNFNSEHEQRKLNQEQEN